MAAVELGATVIDYCVGRGESKECEKQNGLRTNSPPGEKWIRDRWWKRGSQIKTDG